MDNQEQEDFGTKDCNRCGLSFKRKNKFNFFCPTCANRNKKANVSKTGLMHLSARTGRDPLTI